MVSPNNIKIVFYGGPSAVGGVVAVEIKKNNFSPFSRTNSTLRKVFVKKTYSNEKFVKVIGVIKKLPLRRLRGRLRRKMADFIFVDMSLV